MAGAAGGRGPARALRVAGFPYGLAVDGGAVWVLSGTGDSGSGLDRAGRLCTWTPAPVRSPTPRRCRRWMLAGSMSRWGWPRAMAPCGWVAGPYAGGLQGGGILLRVDPASGRVAGWFRDPRWSFQDVLAGGPRGAWVATAAPELLHVVAG